MRATAGGRASSCTGCCAGAAGSTRCSTIACAAGSRSSIPISSTCCASARTSCWRWGACRPTPRSARRWSWPSAVTASARASWRTPCCAGSIASASGLVVATPEDPVEALALEHSHPRWLVARWVARWGAERDAPAARGEQPRGAARRAAVSRRARAARGDARERGRAPSATRRSCRDSLVLTGGVGAMTELGAFKQGLFHLQDPASTLVTRYAAIPAGHASPTCARRRAASRSSSRAPRASSSRATRRSRGSRACARTCAGSTRATSCPFVGDARFPAVQRDGRRADRRAVHGHGHLPPPSRRALAASRERPRRAPRDAALDPARRGDGGAAGRAARSTAPARSRRRRTTRRSRASSPTTRSGGSSRRRRARCRRPCSTRGGCACCRSATAPTARSRRGCVGRIPRRHDAGARASARRSSISSRSSRGSRSPICSSRSSSFPPA